MTSYGELVVCGGRSNQGLAQGICDYLERGLWCIYPGDPDPAGNQTVNLWSNTHGYPAKLVGHCQLDALKSINRPWIIGPFSGKFFSLKSQRVW